MYKDLNTGETYTLEEIREGFEQFKDEMTRWDCAEDKEVPRYESFEDYMDEMLRLGRERIGGYVEVED